MLCQAAGPGMTIYNTSRFVFQKPAAVTGKGYASILGDRDQVAANLKNYVVNFSPNAREVFLDASPTRLRLPPQWTGHGSVFEQLYSQVLLDGPRQTK